MSFVRPNITKGYALDLRDDSHSRNIRASSFQRNEWLTIWSACLPPTGLAVNQEPAPTHLDVKLEASGEEFFFRISPDKAAVERVGERERAGDA
jgi:hypothetical protein